MPAEIFLDVSPAFSQTVCDRASERLDFFGRDEQNTHKVAEKKGGKTAATANASSLKAGKNVNFQFYETVLSYINGQQNVHLRGS